MLRWLGQTSGSGRGEKRVEAEDENVDRACETKRRKFNCKWQTGRHWLVFDSKNAVMFCQICREYTKEKNKTNSFIWHADSVRRRRPEFVRKNIKETSDSEEEMSSESSEDI
ncbi:hypothetical protein QQF64_032893 [Cirrhinus molitorella]|uniref:Uncharacterized protein n=1 Tax=Cirrhinus molitorella TaxID=172907 RepID=A0ABR3MSD3_9TELE